MSSDFIQNGRSLDLVVVHSIVLENIVLAIVLGELVFEQPRMEEDDVHDFVDECGHTGLVVSSGGAQVVLVEHCQSYDRSVSLIIFLLVSTFFQKNFKVKIKIILKNF